MAMEKEDSAAVKKHLAAMAAEVPGDHYHLVGHDDGFTSHHMVEGGRPTGPHEHKTMAAAKKHMAGCMNTEGVGDDD